MSFHKPVPGLILKIVTVCFSHYKYIFSYFQTLPANSYYGATLCTVDVNNDNVDDLLVAAPLYSPFTDGGFTNELELGLVFVYLGSGNVCLLFFFPVVTKNKTFLQLNLYLDLFKLYSVINFHFYAHILVKVFL